MALSRAIGLSSMSIGANWEMLGSFMPRIPLARRSTKIQQEINVDITENGTILTEVGLDDIKLGN